MRRRLFAKWVLACSVGEVFGFGLAAWTVALLLVGGTPDAFGQRLSILVVVLSVGALEGTMLGALQWSVLRRVAPTLSGNAWVGVTAVMALLGWLGGMLVPLFGAGTYDLPVRPPSALLVLGFAALFGVAAGALIGLAQGLVLRPHVARWTSWIWTNALGWGLGLPFTFLSARTAPQTPLDAAVSGAWAGLAMGVCVGVVTSLALLRFTREEPPARRQPPREPWSLAAAMQLDAAGGRLEGTLGPSAPAPESAQEARFGQVISLDGPFSDRPPFHQK